MTFIGSENSEVNHKIPQVKAQENICCAVPSRVNLQMVDGDSPFSFHIFPCTLTYVYIFSLAAFTCTLPIHPSQGLLHEYSVASFCSKVRMYLYKTLLPMPFTSTCQQ